MRCDLLPPMCKARAGSPSCAVRCVLLPLMCAATEPAARRQLAVRTVAVVVPVHASHHALAALGTGDTLRHAPRSYVMCSVPSHQHQHWIPDSECRMQSYQVHLSVAMVFMHSIHTPTSCILAQPSSPLACLGNNMGFCTADVFHAQNIHPVACSMTGSTARGSRGRTEGPQSRVQPSSIGTSSTTVTFDAPWKCDRARSAACSPGAVHDLSNPIYQLVGHALFTN